MELWLIYAIIASVSIGINGYLIKILSDKNIDGGILTFMQGFTYFVLWFSQSIILWWDLFSVTKIGVIGISMLIAWIIFFNMRIRIRVLKYLSTSEYFIGYRIFTTILLLIIGTIAFSEIITWPQIFWLILWSFAIIFLFEEDIKLQKSRNWNKALIYLSLSILAWWAIQIIGKIQGLDDFPYSSMLFYQGVAMLLLSSIIDRKVIRHNLSNIIEHRNILLITFIATLFVYIAASFNLLAYKAWWSVSIVTKIMAYSLFVSIWLAILLWKEKMSYKKWIAFILTIISIYYLN